MLIALRLSAQTDEQLMKRAARGNDHAFEELYNRHARRLQGFFTRRLSGDADLAADFTHDAFLLVTKYPALGLNVEYPPEGRIRDNRYEGGFLEYMTKEYGTIYRVTRAAHFDLIPHWELEAR